MVSKMSLTTHELHHVCRWDGSHCNGLDLLDYDSMSPQESSELVSKLVDGWKFTIRESCTVRDCPIRGYNVVFITCTGIPEQYLTVSQQIPEGSVVIIDAHFTNVETQPIPGTPPTVHRYGDTLARNVRLRIRGIKKASYIWGNQFLPMYYEDRQIGKREDLIELVDEFASLLGREVHLFRETFGQDLTGDLHPGCWYQRW
jgi:hypothetical protein